MVDEIYTPAALANELVELASVTSPSFIADFAAGEGALLEAARAVWPSAGLFGSDLNPESVAKLELRWPAGSFEAGDFLCASLHQTPKFQLLGVTRADLILLNPPFSCRAGKLRQVKIDNDEFLVGPALAFVAQALQYLSPKGELVAVIPDSSLSSERDSPLLNALKRKHVLTDYGLAHDRTFGRFNVRVRKIVVRRSTVGAIVPTRDGAEINALSFPITVSLTRGGLSCHAQTFVKEGMPFVHSTDLRQHQLSQPLRAVNAKRSIVRGPAVLLPRVGRPGAHKIVLTTHGTFALSDCVIGLTCSTANDADVLHGHLVQDWPALRELYRGTCAPYLRLGQLRQYLQARNVRLAAHMRLEEAEAA